jgi:hypothetical protein
VTEISGDPPGGEVKGDGPGVVIGAGCVVGAQAVNMKASARLIKKRLLVMMSS